MSGSGLAGQDEAGNAVATARASLRPGTGVAEYRSPIKGPILIFGERGAGIAGPRPASPLPTKTLLEGHGPLLVRQWCRRPAPLKPPQADRECMYTLPPPPPPRPPLPPVADSIYRQPDAPE